MDKELSYHYYNSHALLVVNALGLIRVLYTPFRVLCISTTAGIPEQVSVYVEEVFSNEKDELIYMIQGSLHSYKNFQVVINF